MVVTSHLYIDALQAIEHSPELAESRYRESVAAGHGEARFQLAVVLRLSDRPAAVELFEALDAEDYEGASCLLGQIYWLDDADAAKYWFRRAAKRSDYMSAASALNLGMLLAAGASASEAEEAEKWLTFALEKGERRAVCWLGVTLEKTAPERALTFYTLAAKEGQKEAYHRAGALLLKRKDMDGARRMYEEGVRAGDTRSMVGLFNAYKWNRPLVATKWLYLSLRAGGFAEFRRGQGRRRAVLAARGRQVI